MKSLSIIFLFLLGCNLLNGQSYADSVNITSETRIPLYILPAVERQVVLTLPYASPIIQNPEKWTALREGNIPNDVYIVYSDYPADYSKWVSTYSGLLSRRIKAMFELDPVFKSSHIRWHLVLQTQCTSIAEAKGLFHGIVIQYEPRPVLPPIVYRGAKPTTPNTPAATAPAPIPPVPYEFSSTAHSLIVPQRSDEVNSIDDIKSLMRGETYLTDSTVLNIMHRHKEWKNCLVVMDWTGSMYKYGAQLLIWHRMNLESNISQVSHFVFFNDGNEKLSSQKSVGKTGGIYKASTNSIQDVIRTMNKTMLGGNGGDVQENDLEAILMGIKKLGDFDEIILIADNSPVRDLSLLKHINRPIRVIICDPYKGYINPQYLKIAFETNGSLHTLKADIERLEELFSPNSTWDFGGGRYEMKEGKVVRVK